MSDLTNQIPLNPNLNCLMQNFLYFLKCQGEVAAQMQKEKKSISNLPNVSSSLSYLTYRKRVHSRLSQINTNISNTIIEGCRGIDTICYKVRQCLSENQYVERSSCSNSNESDELKKNIDGFPEVPSTESAHDLAPGHPEIKQIVAPASSWSVDEKVAKKLSMAKMKRQIRKRNLILEEFRETVMDHIEHNDFEAMDRIVENLNEDIENFDKTVDKEISEGDTEILRAQTMDVQESTPVLMSKENFEVAMAEKRARSLVIPEVYAKASVTDLHKKLIAQLEANDSFLCFQRIMERQKANKKRPATPTSVVCSSSSISSTVSRRKRKTSRGSNSRSEVAAPRKGAKSEIKFLEDVRSELYAKYSDSLWFSQRYLGRAKTSRSSVKSKRDGRERQKTAETGRCTTKPEPKILQKEKNHRTKRAHKATSKSSSITHSDANISLSRCTNSGYSCNLTMSNDLPISPSTKCHLRWIKARNDQAPSRKIEYLDILDDLTPKDLLPLQSEYPRRDRQGGVKFFFDFRPAEGFQSTKSIRDSYLYRLLREGGKQTTWEHLLKPSIECCDFERPLCRSKQRILTPDHTEKTTAQKLLPYLRDPTTDHLHFQSVTVMPVRVFYDHQRTCRVAEGGGYPVEQKIRPALMKEAKGAVRAKWVEPNRESTETLRMVYAGPAKLRQSETKTAASEHSSQRISSRRNSKSFSPRETKKLEKYIRVQSDIEKMSSEIRNKTPKGFERKLWANKYGKSVGHQLVSFVKNQPPEDKPALPKYALPTGPRVVKSTTRHKQMLAHLRGLKQKNDEIQTNIQKAINVIETKMIDILSAPGDSSSVEAFDLMEKEITNVLSMMKFSSKGSSRNPTPKTAEKLAPSPPSKKVDNLEEDFNSISDLLFKKLEKILDSDKSRPTTSASESDKKDEEVHRKKQKPRKSLEADKYLSSSLTSTSLEDTNHRTSNERTSPNERSKFGRCSISAQEKTEQPLTLVEIEKEYATGENCAFESKIFAEQDLEATDNSRGDCIEKSCILSQEEPSSRMLEERKDDESGENKENCETAEETPETPEIVKEEPRAEEPKIPPKSDDDSEASDPSFSDQVNKIIKRVEDIYNHLDDIHTSNNNNKEEGNKIPVFTEPPEVPGVASQQFLTPFMQAVKEKRTQSLQRSPSYYNVLTFLDTLSTIRQQEKTVEVHIARLCHSSRTILFAEVFHLARFEYTAKMEMAGCLRKHNSDEGKSKHKRVSFLVLKENKMCQASICTHHKVRAIKVSSEQFPMSEGDEKLQVSDGDHSQDVDGSELDGPPRIQVFYERFPANEPPKALEGFYSHQTILKVKNHALPEFRPKPKIVVCREVSGMLQPLKGLDRFSGDKQSAKQESVVAVNSEKGDQNVVLLQSFYAFVYIMMFTAMNLDYRCA